jgi:hypothetical protein
VQLVSNVGAEVSESIKSSADQAAAIASSTLQHVAAAAPAVAQDLVEGSLKPAAAEVAAALPDITEKLVGSFMDDEGESSQCHHDNRQSWCCYLQLSLCFLQVLVLRKLNPPSTAGAQGPACPYERSLQPHFT